MKRKEAAADCVMYATAEANLVKFFEDHLRVLTDGCAAQGSHS